MKEARNVGGAAKKSRVDQGMVVVKVYDRFGARQIHGVRLSCVPLTERT